MQRECPRCHNVHEPLNCGVGPGGLQEWECRKGCVGGYRWKEFRGVEIQFSKQAIWPQGQDGRKQEKTR